MSAEAWGCEGVNQAKTRRDKNSQYRESSTCEVRKTGLVLGARRGDGGGERPRMGDGRPVQLKEARKREAVIEVSQDQAVHHPSLSYSEIKEEALKLTQHIGWHRISSKNMSSLPYPGTAKINKNGSCFEFLDLILSRNCFF